MSEVWFNVSYRAVLKGEFEKRVKLHGGAYSLRSFAKEIHLQAPRLSQILKGSDGLSFKSAVKIAEKLGFNKIEKEFFCDLVESENKKSPIKRQLASARLLKFNKRNEFDAAIIDQGQIIKDWYHFAILDLTCVEGFKSDPAWIAKALKITKIEAELGVERLLRAKLLTRVGKTLQATDACTSTSSDIPSGALKSHHQGVLERSLKALYAQSVEQRDFSAIMLPFDKEGMAEAKALLKDFRRSFARSMRKYKKKKKVYCLAIQFFNLTEGIDENGKA